MASIKVSKHGQHFAELTLEKGQTYLLGRGSDCQIIFDSSRSVSRHHLRIEWENEQWMAHLISKVGQMVKNDEPVIVAQLTPNVRLFVDPYEILFIDEEAAAKSMSNDLPMVKSNNKPASLSPQPDPIEDVPSEFDLSEHTAVVATVLAAYVSIEDANGDARTIALKEPYTLFGRDESVQVPLNDAKVSRKHFEIKQAGSQYLVTDLGSANGTKLNNLDLEAHKAYPLTSKDVISINQTRVTFELRDPKFENMLVQFSPPPQVQNELAPYGGMIPYDYSAYVQGAGPAAMKVTPEDWKSKFSALPKKTKMRIGLGGALVIILGFGLFSGDAKPKVEESSQASVNGEAKITPEQQAVVKDTFNLARNHFMQGKYELCSAEIIKLHAIVPFFENSKELETLCSQAKELADLEREKERLQKQKEAIESQVAAIVTECRAKLETFKTEEQINTCLGQAIELDPQNTAIEEMRNYLKIKDDEKNAKIAQDAAYQRQVSAGESKYSAARSVKNQGQLKKAISAYEGYLASGYPDPKNLKATARRELASIKSELGSKVSSRLKQCDSMLQQNKYKEAVKACDEVLKEDSSNADATEFKRLAIGNLKRDMKAIYEDAILEESLGNVDAAKDKWKKIVSEDIRDGDYSTKSRIKLKKYGVEY